MDYWEYFTTILESNTEVAPVPIRDDIPIGQHPVHTPYALIPQLNVYGANGWELLSITPVVPGKKHDVLMPDSSGMKWARHYFCAFKRKVQQA